MENEISNRRDKRYDAIKGLAILIVCIEHIIQVNSYDYASTEIHSVLFAVQMPIFMIVSGYFCGNKIVASAKVVSLNIKNKAIAYLIPFFSHEIIFKPVFFKGENGFERIKIVFPYSMDSGLWFLWVLFVLSTELVISSYITREYSNLRKSVYTVLVYGVFQFITLFLGVIFGMKFLAIKQVLFYSVYFILGYLYKRHLEEFLSKNNTIKSIIACICILVGFYFSANYSMILLGEGVKDVLIRTIAGICLSFVLITFTKQYYEILAKLKIDVLGKYTLEIYYTHGIAFSLLQKSSQYVVYSVNGVTQIVLSIILTTIYTTLLIAIIKCNKISDFLFYGKCALKKN